MQVQILPASVRNAMFSQRFLIEVKRFERCCDGVSETPLGLQQFYDYESTGKQPSHPDPYFNRLLDGKRWWEWIVNQYRDLYFTNEWPGWLCLEEDFRHNPTGLRQIEQRLGRT